MILRCSTALADHDAPITPAAGPGQEEAHRTIADDRRPGDATARLHDLQRAARSGLRDARF
jgi:hypothetical protein